MKRKMILMMVLLFFAVACPAQSIRNSNNSLLGKVDSDGTVRNSNNSVIGYAKGVPMRYAAVFFFFHFF